MFFSRDVKVAKVNKIRTSENLRITQNQRDIFVEYFLLFAFFLAFYGRQVSFFNKYVANSR